MPSSVAMVSAIWDSYLVEMGVINKLVVQGGIYMQESLCSLTSYPKLNP